jgi:electron transfer flavoprotein alpha/beta subunit
MRVVALIRRSADVGLVRAAAALGEVTALAALPDAPEASALLAAARAAGASRLVRLWEPALDRADYLGVAWALAAAVRAIAGDVVTSPLLIVAGDRGRAAVGPAVAERLGVPLLGQVLTVELRDQRVVARRRARGLVRTFAAAPPALVCMPLPIAGAASAATAGAAAPAAAGELAAGDLEAWTLSKVGMSAAELAHRRRFAPTPAIGPTQRPLRLPTAAALIERLRDDGLLPPRPPEGH